MASRFSCSNPVQHSAPPTKDLGPPPRVDRNPAQAVIDAHVIGRQLNPLTKALPASCGIVLALGSLMTTKTQRDTKQWRL